MLDREGGGLGGALEGVLHLRAAEAGVGREQQAGDAGGGRRCNGRASHLRVAGRAVERRPRGHVALGCRDGDPGPVVGVVRLRSRLGHAPDAEDARRRRGIGRAVAVGVACRREHDGALGACVRDGARERGRGGGPGPTQVEHAGAMVDRPRDSRCQARVVGSGVRADLDGHDLAARAVAGVTGGVIDREAGHARNVGAVVAGIRGRVGRAVEDVVTTNELAAKVESLRLQPRVENCDRHAGIALGDVPGLSGVRPVPAPGPATERVAALREVRIARDGLLRPGHRVPLNVGDVRVVRERPANPAHGPVRGRDADVDPRNLPLREGVVLHQRVARLGIGDVRVELDQQLGAGAVGAGASARGRRESDGRDGCAKDDQGTKPALPR